MNNRICGSRICTVIICKITAVIFECEAKTFQKSCTLCEHMVWKIRLMNDYNWSRFFSFVFWFQDEVILPFSYISQCIGRVMLFTFTKMLARSLSSYQDWVFVLHVVAKTHTHSSAQPPRPTYSKAGFSVISSFLSLVQFQILN